MLLSSSNLNFQLSSLLRNRDSFEKAVFGGTLTILSLSSTKMSLCTKELKVNNYASSHSLQMGAILIP